MAAVEIGTVQAETPDGLIWSVDETAHLSVFRKALPLTAGEATALDDATEITYRVLGDETAVIWLVTFVPPQEPSSASPASSPAAINVLPV